AGPPPCWVRPQRSGFSPYITLFQLCRSYRRLRYCIDGCHCQLLHASSCRGCPAARSLAIHRKCDGELATRTRSAVNRDISSMCTGNVLYQRQPQSTPFCVVNQRITDAIKLLKNLLLFG